MTEAIRLVLIKCGIKKQNHWRHLSTATNSEGVTCASKRCRTLGDVYPAPSIMIRLKIGAGSTEAWFGIPNGIGWPLQWSDKCIEDSIPRYGAGCLMTVFSTSTVRGAMRLLPVICENVGSAPRSYFRWTLSYATTMASATINSNINTAYTVTPKRIQS